MCVYTQTHTRRHLGTVVRTFIVQNTTFLSSTLTRTGDFRIQSEPSQFTDEGFHFRATFTVRVQLSQTILKLVGRGNRAFSTKEI